jgi:hypothetical protein
MIIIDRFEGEYAVCEEEDGRFRKIPKVLLPPGSREGDCLAPGRDGGWQTDRAATRERRERIRKKLEALYQ